MDPLVKPADTDAHAAEAPRIAESRGRYAIVVLLLLSGIALVALVLTTGLPSRTRFLALLNNAGHALIFGLLAWIGLRLRAAFRPTPPPVLRDYIGILCAVILIGGVTELIQFATGRGASFDDVLMDTAGATFALCLSALRARSRRHTREPPRQRRMLVAGALLSATIVAAPLTHATVAYVIRRAEFPEILYPDAPLALYFVQAGGTDIEIVPLPERWSEGPSRNALRVTTRRTRTPGVSIIEPEPDWREYSALTVDVVNPEARPLHLMVRVHDTAHDHRHEDRFNRAFVVPPATRSRIEISLTEIASAPKDRVLDLSRVAGVVIFERSPEVPVGTSFYIVRVALE